MTFDLPTNFPAFDPFHNDLNLSIQQEIVHRGIRSLNHQIWVFYHEVLDDDLALDFGFVGIRC